MEFREFWLSWGIPEVKKNVMEANWYYKGFYQVTFVYVIHSPCKNNMGSIVPTTNGDWLEEPIISAKQ